MKRWWIIIALLAAALVLGWAQTNWPEPLRVTFFDIGQGDAALIRTPAHQNILIDGGPDSSVMAKLGRALPWTDHTIDLVVLSHPHADHVAGLVPVLQHYRVRHVLIAGVLHTTPDYIEFLKLIKEKHIPVTIAQAGQTINLNGGVALDVLWPTVSYETKTVSEIHITCVVIKLRFGSARALFTGDLPLEEERALAATGVDLKAQILKVGHHGSRTSSSEEFIRAVAPEAAIIPVGRRNHYGLPDEDVLARLSRLVPHVYRTDESGDVSFVSDGTTWHKK